LDQIAKRYSAVLKCITMKEKFVNYFSRISPLSEEEAKGIEEGMRIEIFKKGTVLLKEGQISVDTYFILEGCIREYVIRDGDEKTTNFFKEDQWVISLNNFGLKSPASNNLVCVEDTTVSVGNEKSAQEMFKQFPRFETISRAVMEIFFTEQKKLLTSFLTDSPEQRYLTLLKSRPDLFQRIPQYQIASYIGVKPESLSRIRKRVLDKLR
jgi:CRP-like cAMP-binding protein